MDSVVRSDGRTDPLTITDLARTLRELQARVDPPIAWRIAIRAGDFDALYRQYWRVQKPMRKKLRRLAVRIALGG